MTFRVSWNGCIRKWNCLSVTFCLIANWQTKFSFSMFPLDIFHWKFFKFEDDRWLKVWAQVQVLLPDLRVCHCQLEIYLIIIELRILRLTPWLRRGQERQLQAPAVPGIGSIGPSRAVTAAATSPHYLASTLPVGQPGHRVSYFYRATKLTNVLASLIFSSECATLKSSNSS